MATNIFRDAKVGDFFGINPNGLFGNTRYFVISDIDKIEDENKVIYIHPGSRPRCLYKLHFEDIDKPWILTFESLDSEGITSWGETDPRGEPIVIDMYDTEFQHVKKPFIVGFGMDGLTFTDYRITREIITNFATDKEYREEEEGIAKSMYEGQIRMNRNITRHPFKRPHIISYTVLGAIVSFMNWIESASNETESFGIGSEEDVFMWDQINPLKYSLERYDSVEDMIEHFQEDNGWFVKQIDYPIEFPGPLPVSYRTKPARY